MSASAGILGASALVLVILVVSPVTYLAASFTSIPNASPLHCLFSLATICGGEEHDELSCGPCYSSWYTAWVLRIW